MTLVRRVQPVTLARLVTLVRLVQPAIQELRGRRAFKGQLALRVPQAARARSALRVP